MKILISSLTALLLVVFAFNNASASKLDTNTQPVVNLKVAFEGESTASAKYAAYAKKAKKRRLHKSCFII